MNETGISYRFNKPVIRDFFWIFRLKKHNKFPRIKTYNTKIIDITMQSMKKEKENEKD